MRKLNPQEIAHVSGGVDPITKLVTGILQAEWKLLKPLFSLLTFGLIK